MANFLYNLFEKKTPIYQTTALIGKMKTNKK